MAGTKKKSAKGKAPSKQPKQPKGQSQAYLEGLQHLPPQEHVAAVKPLWEKLPQQDREALLTVPLQDLRQFTVVQAEAAKKIADAEYAEAMHISGRVVVTLEPPLDEVLEKGLARTLERGTWKVWRWEGQEFYDSDTFRKHLEENVLGEEHRKVLPREPEGSNPAERPAEGALRKRMVALLQRVQERRQAQEEAAFARKPTSRRGDAPHAVRDPNAELVSMMLGAMESEHEALYHHVVHPITAHVCDLLPENARQTTRSELHYEDLDKLLPDDVARICDWLTEKLDALGTKLKREAHELKADDEDDPIGDVDLFTVVDGDSALRVDARWLNHLQLRVLGEEGQPRLAREGEDPHGVGLVLEWVYGTIVSTAEKSRDGARRALGARVPSAEQAAEKLKAALEGQMAWEARARTARELMAEMLTSRKEAVQLAEHHDVRVGGEAIAAINAASAAANGDQENGGEAPPAIFQAVPDAVMVRMLKREALLTTAKLHYLSYEHLHAERTLSSLKAQLRQGEPEFERLKRELEEVKNAPRGLDGTYRTAAEMERHRSQLADAAIEEQIEVQTAFRETGSRLQKILDSRRDAEVQMARREQEIKQLVSWKGTILKMVTNVEDAMAIAAPIEAAAAALQAAADAPAPAPADLSSLPDEVDEEAGEVDDAQRALVAAVKCVTRQDGELARLHKNFDTEIRRQLYTEADDMSLFNQIKSQLRAVEQRLEDGRAALQHLESFVINAACDDPGTTIGVQLVLPFLQERLDGKALEFAAQRAAEAEDEIIRMEMDSVEREKVEREKRAKVKAKAKERQRGERERERAERASAEREAKEKAEAERLARLQEEEEGRQRRAEALEAARRAEEELMERRRQELLADESSYWRQRLQQDDFASAQAELEQQLRAQVEVEDAQGNGITVDAADGFVTANTKPVRRTKEPREKPKVERREEQVPPNGARPRPHQQDAREPRPRVTRDARTGERERPLRRPASVTAMPAASSAAEVAAAPTELPAAPLADGPAAPLPAPASEQPSAPASPAKQLPPAPDTPEGHTSPHPEGHTSPQAPPALLQSQPQPPMMPPGMLPLPTGMPPPPGAVPSMPMPPPSGLQSMAMPSPDASEEGRPGRSGAEMPPGGPGPPPGMMPPGAGMPMPGPPPYGAVAFPPPPHMGQGGLPPGGLPHGMMFFPGHPMPPQMMGLNGQPAQPGAPFVLPPGMLPLPGMIPMPGPMAMHGVRPMRAKPGLPTQLRAAAQPFVPTAALTPPAATGNDAADAPGKQRPRDDSPRGILERSEPSIGPGSNALAQEDAGSANSASEAGSVQTEAAAAPEEVAKDAGRAGTSQPRRSGSSPAAVQHPTAAPPPPPPPPRPLSSSHPAAAAGEADVRRLKLVRGLTNAPGLYNCFLNVIIQSLWHLRSFRRTLLALSPAEVHAQAGPARDVRVFTSLWSVFQALHVAEETGPSRAAAPAVSPRELREALSTTAAARFELGDMHDAAEVLGEIFDCLHRAERGANGQDPTLPRRVKVPVAEARGWAAARLPPLSGAVGVVSPPPPPPPLKGDSPPGAGSVWGDSAALRKVKRAPRAAPAAGDSLVQRLFGLQVQVPLAAPAAAQASAGEVECQQYTKYFHLVPARGLQEAATRSASFEDALLAAEAPGQAAVAERQPTARLLTRPSVITLGVVWESPQAPADAIASTMRALGTSLTVGRVFAGAEDAGVYALRCVVCYSRSHYCAFAFSEEAGCWLLLDDADISAVGGWAEVGAAVLARRLQPSLLFYEGCTVEE